VKVSFFGGLKLNRVHDPDVTPDNRIQVASLLDVAASKLSTIQQPAQARDYEDLAAIVGAGITLAECLGAANAYGKEFNGALSLKALTYFEDGDLPSLSPATQTKLRAMASQVSLQRIPLIPARVGVTQQRGVRQ
jgi:Nucleotidyl transferase AbiEii toxin, Type IV TA system